MTVILMSRSEIDRMNVLRDLAEERIRVSEAATLIGAWPSPGVAVGEGIFGNAALLLWRRADAGKPSKPFLSGGSAD